MPPLSRSRSCFLGLLTALVCTSQAMAWSRVTLRNGFSYDCAAEQAVDSTHTRLFLSATPGSSYVDIATAEIASVDEVPAPASTPAPMASAQKPLPVPASIPTLLASAGTLHNIDVELLACIVHAESGGRVHATSRVGAQGLMQLMPSTAHQLGVTDSFEPEQNIRGGTAFLDALLTRYHDNLALTLAAYNAGPGAVDRFHGIPPYRETRAYVVRVMTEFKRRKAALLRNAAANTLQASR